MKIVFLLQDTGQIYGAERATLDLVTGLRDAGCDVAVILIEETRLGLAQSPVRAAFSALGVELLVFATDRRFSRPLAAQIRGACERLGASVLHSTGYKADLHAWLALHKSSITFVSTVHGWLNRPDVKERFYAWLNLRAFGRCDRVVVLTRYYEQILRARGLQWIERIPTGMDVLAPALPSANARPLTFGILGRLSSEKNHALFLAAAERALQQRPDLRFLIAGDGPLREEITSQMRTRGLENAVTCCGYLPADDFFRRIDALVVCSRIENLPMVIMEAMARSLPVVATRVGGIPDLVDDGVTGRLVGSEDATSLTSALLELADSPDKGEAWGKAGREKLCREFSRATWIGQHVRMYEALTRSRDRKFQ